MSGIPVRRRYAVDDGPSHSRFETDDYFNLFTTDAPYTQVFDYQGGTNLVYLGQAAPGNLTNTALAVWRIRRFTYDVNSNVLTVAWATNARGQATFDQVWNNRAALSYG
jgi:hypothetical protein